MYKLRPYQQEAVDDSADFLLSNRSKKKNGFIIEPTGCLSWDTIINENRCSLGRKKTIQKMYRNYNQLNKNKRYNYDKSKPTYVRSFIKKSNTIQLNEINGVKYSGVKDLFYLKLINGLELKATPDHKIMTNKGWVQMKDLTTDHNVMCDTLKAKKSNKKKKKFYDNFVCNLWFHPFSTKVKTNKEKRGFTKRIEVHRFIYEANLNNITTDEFKYILRKDPLKSKKLKYINPKVYDIHHKDGNHYNNDIDNLEKIDKIEHQKIHSEKNKYNFNQGKPVFSKVKSVFYYGKDHTYDICCIKDHNFVANGMVVHNSGKSIIIANIAMKLDAPTLILQPSKELLLQNHKKYISYGYDASIFSASVGVKEVGEVTFATIGSIYKKPELFKEFKYALIDECHRLSPKEGGMYFDFFQSLNMKILGLSATPFRLKAYNFPEPHSKLNFLNRMRPKMFHEVVHLTQISEMTKNNWWSPLEYITESIDTSKLRLNSTGANYTDESIQQTLKFNKTADKAIYWANKLRKEGRKQIIIFLPSIEEANYVAKKLKINTINSETKKKDRERILKDFESGKDWAITNVNVLSIGYDNQKIDALIDCSPTLSLAMYYQKLGRGVRTDMSDNPTKKDCIVVDLAGNYDLFGRIEDLVIDLIDNKWVVRSGNKILTNTPIIKDEGISELDDEVIGFGKFEGERFKDVPKWYWKYIAKNFSKNSKNEKLFQYISFLNL